jgi:hypothetical protein
METDSSGPSEGSPARTGSDSSAPAGASTPAGGGAPTPLTVSASEITGHAGEAKNLDLVVLTDKDKAALVLANWTGAIGALLIFVILLNFMCNMRNLPSAPVMDKSLLVPPKTLAEAQALLSYYKSVTDLTADQSTKIFDIIVTKTLLPIFTLILGFVFGSRTEKQK